MRNNNTLKKSTIKTGLTELSGLINYLTLYVNMQEAVVDKIIIRAEQKCYKLTNSHNREICSSFKKDNDLIDVLITLAPKQIEIYDITQFTDKELLKIIIAIFKERVNMYSDANIYR